MAKLSTAQRKNLDKAQFALPGKNGGPNRFPIPDPNHARNALARASEGVKKHTITPAQAAEIRRKVHAKFPNIK